jgi:hypothetical protein
MARNANEDRIRCVSRPSQTMVTELSSLVKNAG